MCQSSILARCDLFQEGYSLVDPLAPHQPQSNGRFTASTIAANCNGDFVWLVFHYGFHCISKWMLNFYVSGEEMFISVVHQVF